ncbi:hypothetical protein F4778DRAFT_767433 [Xylariomycetidae sp. FL2044]|nr:hypothetical protein F4778DRAFT_767433 [Xylariomycetidae sp. FL2044]
MAERRQEQRKEVTFHPITSQTLASYIDYGAREAEAAKKAEQARKKAEKDALAAEEEKSLPSKPAPKKNKSAVAKPKQGSGLDQALKGLSVDDDEKKTLSATGLDDILDLFEVVGGAPIKVIKHPERKYPGALAAYQEKRLIQAHDEGLWRGLRLEQKKQKIAKEFKNHPDNPHTWLVVDHNASREQISAIVEEERARREAQLTHKD